jgi:hypothetical protein
VVNFFILTGQDGEEILHPQPTMPNNLSWF